jgi:hypothetical protein
MRVTPDHKLTDTNAIWRRIVDVIRLAEARAGATDQKNQAALPAKAVDERLSRKDLLRSKLP